MTSLQLSSYGLNLHHCCSRSLILQYNWTANAIMQAIGRLTRLGKQKKVS